MRFDLAENRFVETDVAADAWAVIGADRSLRWSELAAEADAWCESARAHGFAADVPVILHGHKEASFFVAMAGALLLGAPFVPLDTIYPDERMRRIADELGAAMYYDASAERFAAFRTDGEAAAKVGVPPESTTATPLRETGLAYVLFTSGTTGTPKGVQIGRESVQALVDWMSADFALGTAPGISESGAVQFRSVHV